MGFLTAFFFIFTVHISSLLFRRNTQGCMVPVLHDSLMVKQLVKNFTRSQCLLKWRQEPTLVPDLSQVKKNSLSAL